MMIMVKLFDNNIFWGSTTATRAFLQFFDASVLQSHLPCDTLRLYATLGTVLLSRWSRSVTLGHGRTCVHANAVRIIQSNWTGKYLG
jgi:hypothetical protein